MPFNGSGLFTRLYNWTNDAANNIDINSGRMDGEDNGFANGLSTCLTKDGQQIATANLPMGGFIHTNVGNATARNNYAAVGQIQDGGLVWVVAGGTSDALTATYSPAIAGLVDGMELRVRATAANATTTPTFAPNGFGPNTITKLGGAALLPGDIAGNLHELQLRYNSANTRWELLNPTFGELTWYGTAGGSASAQTLTPTPALVAYFAGLRIQFIPTTSAGATTLAVSALAAKNIKKSVGGALISLIAGDLNAVIPAYVIYDGTEFILLNPQSGSSSFVGTTSYNIATASGTQAITGVGFTPKSVIFLVGVNGTFQSSWGTDNLTTHFCMYNTGTSFVNGIDGSHSIVIQTSGGNNAAGAIQSMDADGFTINWTKTGTPTGSATLNFLAMR